MAGPALMLTPLCKQALQRMLLPARLTLDVAARDDPQRSTTEHVASPRRAPLRTRVVRDREGKRRRQRLLEISTSTSQRCSREAWLEIGDCVVLHQHIRASVDKKPAVGFDLVATENDVPVHINIPLGLALIARDVRGDREGVHAGEACQTIAELET